MTNTSQSLPAENYFKNNTLILFLSLLSIFALSIYQKKIIWYFLPNPDYNFLIVIISFLFSFIFYFFKYEKLNPLLISLCRYTSAGLVIYLILEKPEFTLIEFNYKTNLCYIEYAYYPSIISAVIGLIRPSFILPAANYIIATRLVVEKISGFSISVLDIRYLVEMAQYLSLSIIFIFAATATLRKITKKNSVVIKYWDNLANSLQVCIAFNAIALHLGNYFWSGFAKLKIGPTLLHWVMENQTEHIILGALEKGVLPLYSHPKLLQEVYVWFGASAQISNALVLCFQLLAIFAMLRMAWLIWVSIAYDFFHIGIYVFGGLFFWPWIWINVSILAALRVAQKKQLQIPFVAKISCFLCIIIGGLNLPLMQLSYARLAWYDVTSIKSPLIQLKTPQRDWVNVPVSFFLSHSYSFSHGYFDKSIQSGHYPPSIWGSVQYEHAKHVTNCSTPEPMLGAQIESDIRKKVREELITKFIRAHHQKILSRVDANGKYNPYLRSHHHPSNPLMYKRFNAIDLRKVTSYRQVTQSVCLSLKEGELQRKVLNEYYTNIDIK